MKTTQYINRRKQKRFERVFTSFLRHKGHEAQVYKFTTKLFKKPSYKIAGFQIAIETGIYLDKTCIYYSLIK